MNLEVAKEMDRKCVLNWLNEVYITPSLSYSEYTDEEIRTFAHDAIVLLTEDYRSWLMDMFHKYDRDDLAALLVRYGEEDLLATVLKEQEAVEPVPDYIVRYWRCPKCNWLLTSMIDDKHDIPLRRDNYCAKCGRKVKWK